MYCYASINEDGICYGLMETSDKITDEEVLKGKLLISEYNPLFLGKRYKEGEWVEVEKTEPVSGLAFEQEILLETANNAEYLVCLKDLEL